MKGKKKLLLTASITIFLGLIACVIYYYQPKALRPVEATTGSTGALDKSITISTTFPNGTTDNDRSA